MVFDVLVRRALRRAMRGDEQRHSLLAGEIARGPGRVVWGALFVTVLTGIYNLTWYVPGGLWNVLSYLPQAPVLVAKLSVVGTVLTASGIYIVFVGPRLKRAGDPGLPAERVQRWRRENLWLTAIATGGSFVAVFVAVFL
jgi:uncharacterized membrane protein